MPCSCVKPLIAPDDDKAVGFLDSLSPRAAATAASHVEATVQTPTVAHFRALPIWSWSLCLVSRCTSQGHRQSLEIAFADTTRFSRFEWRWNRTHNVGLLATYIRQAQYETRPRMRGKLLTSSTLQPSASTPSVGPTTKICSRVPLELVPSVMARSPRQQNGQTRPTTTRNSSSVPSSRCGAWCASSVARTTNFSAIGLESTRCTSSRRLRS